jgi:hypothetical protein
MRLSIKIAGLSAVCASLAACVPQNAAGVPASPEDLRSARAACNEVYPRRVGNYLPHARCVNAAVEAYALSSSRNPDLVRLQAQVRETLSEKIDRRRLSVEAGQRRMAEADRLIAEAETERAAGQEAAAARHVAAVEKLLR